ncbi:MAG TPA: metallophosphatase domain-containing protein [Bacteroidia bacterium]|jgi:Icc-related predicted phosphoesterase|nr:metallophosphatase domain-containing protein [Bacteroidia bacterium]
MKIVALSDTHGQHRDVTVPDGDVLMFAGDLMGSGYKHSEVKDFAEWFSNQPHKYKILVAGNHDRMFETNLDYCLSKFSNVVYLQDSGTEINGVKFWGSPWQPWFYNWAFNVPRGPEIAKYWAKIPGDTDVLITHGPPYGILDQAIPDEVRGEWSSDIIVHPSEHLGCEELGKQFGRIMPKVHIFGHIHGSYGTYNDGIRFYNVSICDEQYNPVNPVTVIEV